MANYIFVINAAMKSRMYPELSTGAMSDIAFLLLIFFVTTTEILDERGIQVTLPPINAQGIEVHDSGVFHMYINAVNEIRAGTALTDIHALEEVLYAYISAPGEAGYRNRVISMHCDRDSMYETYVGVYDAIRRAYKRMWNEIAFARFQSKFSTLSGEDKHIVMSQLPLSISEAEWFR